MNKPKLIQKQNITLKNVIKLNNGYNLFSKDELKEISLFATYQAFKYDSKEFEYKEWLESPILEVSDK